MESKYQNLEKLNDLYQKGIITEEEFKSEREKILSSGHSSVTTDSQVKTYSSLMHLSRFAGYLLPGLGFLAPIIMWGMRRSESTFIDKNGKVIFNWMISSCIYIIALIAIFFAIEGASIFSLATVADSYVHESEMFGPIGGIIGGVFIVGIPLIAIGILDIIFTIIGAVKANDGQVWNYPLSIRFFKTTTEG